MKFTRNWHDIALLYIGIKKKADFKFRNTPYILSEVTRDYIALPLYFSKVLAQGRLYFENSNIVLKFRDLTFSLYNPKIDIPYIYSVFVDGEYNKFSFKDKVVLDIGAYIGDTSVFFAVNGARRVLAYEPNPEVFKKLLQNISLNNMQEKILPFNMAVGREGYINFFLSSYTPGSTMFQERFYLKKKETISKQIKVRSVSIATILNEISSVDILKMDCEGCEFVILQDLVDKGLGEKIREGIIFEAHVFDSRLSTIEHAISLVKALNFKRIFVRKVSDITSFIWAYRHG